MDWKNALNLDYGAVIGGSEASVTVRPHTLGSMQDLQLQLGLQAPIDTLMLGLKILLLAEDCIHRGCSATVEWRDDEVVLTSMGQVITPLPELKQKFENTTALRAPTEESRLSWTLHNAIYRQLQVVQTRSAAPNHRIVFQESMLVLDLVVLALHFPGEIRSVVLSRNSGSQGYMRVRAASGRAEPQLLKSLSCA